MLPLRSSGPPQICTPVSRPVRRKTRLLLQPHHSWATLPLLSCVIADDGGGKLIKMESHDVSASSSSCFPRMWSDLPTDVLQVIADKVDALGILRLRAVCHPWRSSLAPLLSEPAIQFPLKLPDHMSLPSSNTPRYFNELIETTFYRIYPPDDSSNSWLVRVESTSKPNVFSLLEPLTGRIMKIGRYSKNQLPESVNLLNHRILLVSKSYCAVHVRDGGGPIGDIVDRSLEKVVVAGNFRKMSELLVMGLRQDGRLLIWRYGDKTWTPIMTTCGLRFDDIISYRGTFYATARWDGHLVKFSSTFKPIMLAPRLENMCRRCTHLLESNGELYLVDVVEDDWLPDLQHLRFGVYRLVGESSQWDNELDLQGRVFFVGDDGAFAVDKEDFSGCIGNCIYFTYMRAYPGVYYMDTGMTEESSVNYPSFYWPPPSWVYGSTASSSC